MPKGVQVRVLLGALMNVRYYSPLKEGKRLKFYHVSKHGGSFVNHVLRKLFERKNVEDAVEKITNDPAFLTATVFRHPHAWYKSFHAFYLLNGSRKFCTRLWGEDAWSDDLNRFVENVTQRECNGNHPFLTSRYKGLLEVCDLVGTTENLRDCLAHFLSEAGYDFNEEVIKSHSLVRAASVLPEYTQELTDESKGLIHALESEAFRMWEEVHAKSQT